MHACIYALKLECGVGGAALPASASWTEAYVIWTVRQTVLSLTWKRSMKPNTHECAGAYFENINNIQISDWWPVKSCFLRNCAIQNIPENLANIPTCSSGARHRQNDSISAMKGNDNDNECYCYWILRNEKFCLPHRSFQSIPIQFSTNSHSFIVWHFNCLFFSASLII